jgi:CspA family cold shock protein
MTQEKLVGVVKFFNVQKGFGFIAPEKGGGDIFVHINNVKSNARDLKEGTKVTYTLNPSGRKGPEAGDVEIAR